MASLTLRRLLCKPQGLAQSVTRPGAVFTSRRYVSFLSDDDMGRNSPSGRKRLPINWGINIVPQQRAWIVERFGKFQRVLPPGLHFLVPIVDRITYVHSLKEEALPIPNQAAITSDNVTLTIDGVLYIKVVDPYKASYGVEDVLNAVSLMAQTTMRNELGKLSLDRTFSERESLNANIVEAINEAAASWGLECLRYEIRDITPPKSVRLAMDMQAEAERRKRALILESEGEQQAKINQASGIKQSSVLLSEGEKIQKINTAEGEAQAILKRAKATSEGIEVLARSMNVKGGSDAVSLEIASQYVKAFSKLAKKNNTMILPSNTGDVGSMVAQAMAIYGNINSRQSGNGVDAETTKQELGEEAQDEEMDAQERESVAAEIGGKPEDATPPDAMFDYRAPSDPKPSR